MAALGRDSVADVEILDDGVGFRPRKSETGEERQETRIGADVLELYCRFRAKDEPDMPQKTWIELLEKTIPKLKVGSERVAGSLL